MAITKVTNRNGSTLVVDPVTDRIIGHRATFFCDSTDDLPQNANNGDKLVEMDTEITRYYSAVKGWQPPRPVKIYGVTWDGSANPKMTRTDAAADFVDPVPSVGGSAGSSPFDNIMPWAGMQIVEDEFAGTMVSIPKFYYKITKTGRELSLQIADAPVPGFSVSPAHMDRGDGKGERDVVYIARYKCSSTNGMSVTGAYPLINRGRSDIRTDIRTKQERYGMSGYSIQDYAMFWTVRMLMLVEFATWDFQGAIGYGCGGEGLEYTGSTDNMGYHTGTVSESVETYAVGIQYRYIEDLWANVFEHIDGIRIDPSIEVDLAKDAYIIINPTEFSDNEGGIKVCTIPQLVCEGSFIKDWNVPTIEGYSWALTPSDVSYGCEYVTDFCTFSYAGLAFGGSYNRQTEECGPFCFDGFASSGNKFTGARLQKIP